MSVHMYRTNGQSNLITDRIAAANGRFSGIRQVAPVCTPSNIMLSWAHLSPNPKQQCISIASALLHSWKQRVATLYNGLLHSKLPLPVGIWIPTNTWFLEPTRVLNQQRHLNRFSLFAGFTTVTDRPTDRQTTLLSL